MFQMVEPYRWRITTFNQLTNWPCGISGGGNHLNRLITVIRVNRDNHANAAIKGAEQFSVINLAKILHP
jgi:hypothetical protein